MALTKNSLLTRELVSRIHNVTKSQGALAAKRCAGGLTGRLATKVTASALTSVSISLLFAGGVFAQSMAPISLRPQIAQLQDPRLVNPTIIPTDVTPIGIGRERELQRPGYSFYLFQKLPPKLWFNATTEVTQRLETNVYFTNNNPRPDYVFRVQPNITVGYKILPKTSVYANYFLIKDVFADNGTLTNPTFQSVSGGVLHDIPIKTRTNLQLQWQFRELWQSSGVRQADMIPGVTLTHAFTPKLIGFANMQLQLRSRNLFVTGNFREIDPFYTLGLLYRHKRWNFVATNTFVTNYRFPDAIVPQNNLVMISDFEASHPISKKIPSLVAFVRAEPIFNWASRSVPGLSGFDFRLFSGIRWNISKNAYDTELTKLRKYLKDGGDPTMPGFGGGGGGSQRNPRGGSQNQGGSAPGNNAPSGTDPQGPSSSQPVSPAGDNVTDGSGTTSGVNPVAGSASSPSWSDSRSASPAAIESASGTGSQTAPEAVSENAPTLRPALSAPAVISPATSSSGEVASSPALLTE